jgi:hypothetical protein
LALIEKTRKTGCGSDTGCSRFFPQVPSRGVGACYNSYDQTAVGGAGTDFL